MKAPVLLPAALILLLGTLLSGQDWSLHVDPLRDAVFKLEGNDGFCSAILINDKDDVVLTAGHCVPEKVEGRAIAVNEKHAEVLRVNAILDLALLRVPEIGGRELAIRKDDIRPGLPVAVVGHGLAADWLKFGFGWVSDARDRSIRALGDRIYFSTVGVVGGHSGGAVVDTAGRLVSG